MATRILLRRDTAAAWNEANPVLGPGEAGYDSTANQMRLGDGATAWLDLTPLTSPDGDGGGGGGIEEAPTDGQQYGRQSGGWTVINSGGGGGPGLALNWTYSGTAFFARPEIGEIKLHPDGTAIYISKTNAAGDDITTQVANEVMAGNLFSLQVPARTNGDASDPNQYQQFSIQQNPVSQGDWWNVAVARIIDANSTTPWVVGSTSLDMVVQMAPSTRTLLTDPEEQPEDLITDPELITAWEVYKEAQGWADGYIPTQADVNHFFNEVDHLQQAELRDIRTRVESLESSGGGGGPSLPGTINLIYKGTSYWPSSLAQGEAMAHPDDATLFLPNLDLNGFELADFLDEFVRPGTTFLITETGDKNRWAHLEATGTPVGQSWGCNIPTNRIGGKFEVRQDREISLVIDLAHAAQTRIGAGTDSMSAVATDLSSAVDQLKQQLQHEQEQRKLLEFQLRSVFSAMSKSAQTKLRGVFPENGNEPHQEWDGGDC